MRISVIGCGYLGAVHAAAMASLGHEVVGIDVDERKIDALRAGRAPFFEPGLPELLLEAGAAGGLTFSTDIAAVAGARVHFVCVGTPQMKGEFRADMRYVDASVTSLLPYLQPGDVVVGKSTVPVGTAERLAEQIAPTGATLIWNPEFLREGFAVEDTLHPDRFVYGLPTDEAGVVTAAGEAAKALLDEVYATPLSDGTPLVVTDYPTAQLVKVAANSFLATKISFINAMAELCEATGGDVTQLADAIGYDVRIGRKFLNAGLGFGGGCLPKDIRAFMARAGELGVDQALTFLREVDSINGRRRERMVELAREVCEGTLVGKRVAVLGATFKPNSDDIRDSPALAVADMLDKAGAHVVVTDPQGIENARAARPDLHYADDVLDAVRDADVVLLGTEWAQYRELDPDALAGVVAGRHILDGRNVLDPARWRAAGWTYRALGRP
ncbi:UDP-glucose/GDP-mannose dehydrogenase family protein [Cellulomonas sp. PSBB021]|uniref:UDP-glucose dehydrogenase family protein n=1 Tax=Cellulomonas sp. PSBB021 TaxID=2003551 RepID=UPI000B8D72BC|nr:UDP-glucose/GDP-mannose dehydrogenase family protein [Cellulomonas sp. PSBB021]ASR56441.1 UDP-glucose 6-dehydrogenase [Cellulomonas sp. PSBB021]